jgi:hypothetical protein
MSVVDSIGDPKMLLGNVAEVNAAMIISDGMMIAALCPVTNKFDRIAPSHMIVDITAAVNAGRRFTAEFGYPTGMRPDRAEQSQRLRPPFL